MKFLMRILFDPDPPDEPTGGGDPPVTPDPPAEPELIMGKYKSNEAQLAAHVESESTIARLNAEITTLKGSQAPAATPPEDAGLVPISQPPEKTAPQQIDVDAILESNKLDPQVLARQWTDHRTLTEDQYKVFEKDNISRNSVDRYIAGQHAIYQLDVNTQKEIRAGAVQILGGEDAVNTIITFKNTLPDGRQEDINNRLRDPNTYRGALIELSDEFNRANNLEGSKAIVVGSGRTPSTTGGGSSFSSRHEMAIAAKEARTRGGGQPNTEFNDAEFVARMNATDMSKL